MDIRNNTSNTLTDDSFWQAINILITKPHVLNKRLWGCKFICKHYVNNFPLSIDSVFDKLKLADVTKIDKYCEDLVCNLQPAAEENESDTEILLTELLPKNYLKSHAFQLITLYKSEGLVKFIDITPYELKQNLCPTFTYSFCLRNNKIELITSTDISSRSKQWLRDIILPQVIKWSTEFSDKSANKVCNESLTLVSHEEYYKKYNSLKLKYGKEMLQIWPECTDPSKFVYEDIAIASYLLLLWEELKGPQTFVDVGCGNGLLVYILAMEGYHGYGVDVRKRKIWELYPSNIELKEMTVTSSNFHLFCDVDWIIGNHSDELTPWIPVIAAKSSYKTNFFLLPCCAYNFDGSKYQRQNASNSQYTEYLEYLQNLCCTIGFKIELDRLKIPSTKRICLIGRLRNYRENDYNKYCSIIQNLLNKHIGVVDIDLIGENKILKVYKTRDPVEKVRNCTQVDKTITQYIIKCITNYLLDGCHSQTTWSRGKKVIFNDLVKIIPIEKLKALKSECGGLQTLLKNHHQIFEVKAGFVQLRYPRNIDEVKGNVSHKKTNSSNNIKVKVKNCWFYSNHPQGCPLENAECSFLHEKMLD